MSASFSPDSSKVVTASVDQTARIHEATTGKLLQEFKGHTTSLVSARFSPNGKQVLSYGHGVNHKHQWRLPHTFENAVARIWDVATGKEVTALDFKAFVWTTEFNRDGTSIVTAGGEYRSEKNFAIWDSTTGKVSVTFKGEPIRRRRAIGGTFSPDGKRVATSSYENVASIWDATTGEELHVLAGHSGIVRTAKFSADGQKLITTSEDKTARIWDVADRSISVRKRALPWQPSAAILSDDGRRVYTMPFFKDSTDSPPGDRAYDTTTGEFRGQAASGSPPLGIHFASGTVDHRWIAYSEPDNVTTVTIHEGDRLQERFKLAGHERRVKSIVFSPSNERLRAATIDEAGVLRLWDMANGKLLHTLAVDANHPIRQAHFDGTGRRLFTANELRDGKGKDDQVRACVWEVEKGTRIATILVANTKEELADESAMKSQTYDLSQIPVAALSPDGERIVIAFQSVASPRVFNATTGEQLLVLKHGKDQVTAAAFSPDGKQIITGSHTGKARIWETPTGKLLRTLDQEGAVYAVAFSPRGRLVSSMTDYRAMRVWDSETGQLFAHFKDPIGIVRGGFSSDGESLLLIHLRPEGPQSGKCSARIWPIDPLAEAIRRKPRELTAAEREQYGMRAD